MVVAEVEMDDVLTVEDTFGKRKASPTAKATDFMESSRKETPEQRGKSSASTPKAMLSQRNQEVAARQGEKSPAKERRSRSKTPKGASFAAKTNTSTVTSPKVTPGGRRGGSSPKVTPTAVFSESPSRGSAVKSAPGARNIRSQRAADTPTTVRKAVSPLKLEQHSVSPKAFEKSSGRKMKPRESGQENTPPSRKRKAATPLSRMADKRKRVSFGPSISPELFSKDLPPSTPVRKGNRPKGLSSSVAPEKTKAVYGVMKRRHSAVTDYTAIEEESPGKSNKQASSKSPSPKLNKGGLPASPGSPIWPEKKTYSKGRAKSLSGTAGMDKKTQKRTRLSSPRGSGTEKVRIEFEREMLAAQASKKEKSPQPKQSGGQKKTPPPKGRKSPTFKTPKSKRKLPRKAMIFKTPGGEDEIPKLPANKAVALRAIFGAKAKPRLPSTALQGAAQQSPRYTGRKSGPANPVTSPLAPSTLSRSARKILNPASADEQAANPAEPGNQMSPARVQSKVASVKKRTWAGIAKKTPLVQPTKSRARAPMMIKKRRNAVKVKDTKARKSFSRTPKVIPGAVQSTGHVDSPATVIIKKPKKQIAIDTSPSSSRKTPPGFMKDSSAKSVRSSSSNISYSDIPSTPIGPGEMVVSPMSYDASPNLVGSPRLMGVRSLVKTPKSQSSPRLEGLRKMMQSPKASKPATNKEGRLVGVRDLLKTPRRQASPKVSGMKKMLKTPGKGESPSYRGVREVLKTPKIDPSPKLDGVRNLVKTPRTATSPNLDGIQEMLEAYSPPGLIELLKRGQAVSKERLIRSMTPSPKKGRAASKKTPQDKSVEKSNRSPEASPVKGRRRGTRKAPAAVSPKKVQKPVSQDITSESDEVLPHPSPRKRRGGKTKQVATDVTPPKPKKGRGRAVKTQLAPAVPAQEKNAQSVEEIQPVKRGRAAVKSKKAGPAARVKTSSLEAPKKSAKRSLSPQKSQINAEVVSDLSPPKRGVRAKRGVPKAFDHTETPSRSPSKRHGAANKMQQIMESLKGPAKKEGVKPTDMKKEVGQEDVTENVKKSTKRGRKVDAQESVEFEEPAQKKGRSTRRKAVETSEAAIEPTITSPKKANRGGKKAKDVSIQEQGVEAELKAQASPKGRRGGVTKTTQVLKAPARKGRNVVKKTVDSLKKSQVEDKVKTPPSKGRLKKTVHIESTTKVENKNESSSLDLQRKGRRGAKVQATSPKQVEMKGSPPVRGKRGRAAMVKAAIAAPAVKGGKKAVQADDKPPSPKKGKKSVRGEKAEKLQPSPEIGKKAIEKPGKAEERPVSVSKGKKPTQSQAPKVSPRKSRSVAKKTKEPEVDKIAPKKGGAALKKLDVAVMEEKELVAPRRGRAAATKKVVSPSAKKKASPLAKKKASPLAKKKASPPAKKKASPPAKKKASPPAKKKASPPAKKKVSPPAKKAATKKKK